jgi:hypothetical protein
MNFSHPTHKLFEVVPMHAWSIVCPDEPTDWFVIDEDSVIAWRPKMQNLTMQSMMTMQYVPKLDRRSLGYGVTWILAIATSAVGVAAYV